MEKVTASTLINAQRPDEEPFQVSIEVGVPYRVNDDPDEWACPAALKPLYKNLHDAHGGDPVQSLCLALSLVFDLLSAFREKGGKLYMKDGDDFPIEAYRFGVAAKK